MRDWVLQEAVEQLSWKVRYLMREVEKLKAVQAKPVLSPDAAEQQDTEERVKGALRAQAAVSLIEATDGDIEAETLAKMLSADGGIPAPTALKWLRGVVVKGVANPDHPMFSWLIDKKPLRFGKNSLASPVAPVAQ